MMATKGAAEACAARGQKYLGNILLAPFMSAIGTVIPTPGTHYRKARLKTGEIVFEAPHGSTTMCNAHSTVENPVCKTLFASIFPGLQYIVHLGCGSRYLRTAAPGTWTAPRTGRRA